MKKKLLLTSLVICIGIILFGVVNASAATSGYFTYTVSNGETTITKCNEAASGIVTVPDMLGGYPVTVVDYQAFYNCDNITGIVFGKNVKVIGSYVTLGCDNITSISMADSVTSIGQYAFSGLKISHIILSENITSMGSGVLANCKNLIWTVLPEKITVLQTNTFSQCTSLQKVFVPKTVASISYYAFQNCNNLTDVYFGGSQTQWNNISITSDNMSLSSLKNATIHYNTPARYTISYNANGGSNAPATQTKIYNISAYLSSAKPTRYGYTFKIWNTKADGTGTSYNSGAIYSANASITLYAQWTPNQYTVNYYSNDEKNLLLATSYHDYGVSRQLFKMGYKREGYKFLGWGTSKNATTVKYTDEETVLNLSTTNGGVINLYAVWELAECTVAYDANGGENAPAAHTATAFTDVILSSDIPTREGYVFEGWSEEAGSNAAQYQPGDAISVGVTDITLYAVWKEYTIVASGNCGDNITWMLDDKGTLCINGAGNMPKWQNTASVPWYSHRNSITEVIIGENITGIGSYAFCDCSELAEITIPRGITQINGDAFRNCYKLSNVIFENDSELTRIDSFAFGRCAKLTEIDIPDSVEIIGSNVFDTCIMLTNINFGKKSQLEVIGYSAFCECTSLAEIFIPKYVSSIGERAFDSCTALLSITVDDENLYYSNDERGVLFNKDKTFLIQYPAANSSTSYTIPECTVNIGYEAFCYAHSLKNIVFAENSHLALIGEYAFADCKNLVDVDIPSSVTSIGSGAFSTCSQLVEIDIHKNIEDIGEFAFAGCTALTYVRIWRGVKNIGYAAFRECESLENVYYYGTEVQWGEIAIGTKNESLTNCIKFIYPHTETLISENGKTFIVNPINVDAGKTVIIALYKNNEFIEMQSAVYESETLTFTTTKEYDTVKIMVWNGLTDLIPLSEPEII